MQQPLVSVIIPNYCHARYLDERIQSVLGQTYQDFELIILDDCSPDDGASREVIERYRTDPHVSHIIYNETNTGSPFQQWHKGFDLAKGELVWIAESDDKCDEHLLKALVERLCRNSKASVAFRKSALDKIASLYLSMRGSRDRKLVLRLDNNLTIAVGRIHQEDYALLTAE